jgi:PAS domain S-box-containing protein
MDFVINRSINARLFGPKRESEQRNGAKPLRPTAFDHFGLAQFQHAPLWWRAAFCLGLGFIGWLLTAPERTLAMRQFSVGFLVAFNLIIAWAFHLAARRAGLPRAVRMALALFALAATVTGLGAAYLLVERWQHPDSQSVFSVADGLFLLSYPLILIALALLPRGEQPAAGLWRIILDGAACVAGVGVPLWFGAVGSAWRNATGLDAALVVIWPCAAFIGLVAINAALLTRAPLPSRGALRLLLAGVCVSWLADLIFSLDASALVIQRSAVNWINVVNAAALCLSLVAAWRFCSDPLPAQPNLRPAAFSPVPMATMIVVAVWLVLLSLTNPSNTEMEHRILPGLILLFLVLFAREMFVLGDTVRGLEMEFRLESQARTEAMVRQSSDVIMVVDARRTIRFATPSVLQALGQPAAQVQGQPLLKLCHPEDSTRAARFLDALQQSPATVSRLQWRLQHSDGSLRHFETLGSNALREPMVAGFVLNSRDVTERMQLEEDLRESRKLEAISRLVGGIAHNFNNILAATFLRLDLIRMDQKLPPETEKEIAALQEQAKRTAEIVNHLRSFGRIQYLNLKRVDLARTLVDLQPVLRRLVGERIQLHVEDDNRPKWINADGALINEVIFSLCANARDAMPQGGQLTITSSRVAPGDHADFPDGVVCLGFRDTGRGMEEVVRQHLFEPFFTTKGVGLGLGLELAAVHGIVEQHRGRLRVESTVGCGTTFRVYLPAVSDDPVV